MTIRFFYCRSCRKLVEGRGICPDCGGGKTNACRVDELMRDNPRWSEALGINPSQEADFRKSFPNLDLTFDQKGRCLVKNRAHKLALMKARGFHELE
jgi:hypothetical protein